MSVAWALLGVLAIAVFAMTIGQRDRQANPQITSYSPSGVAAFAQLLRDSGYRVSSSDALYPDLSASDVVVACMNEDSAAAVDRTSPGIYGHLGQFVHGGGRVLLLPFSPDFADAQREVSPEKVYSEADGSDRQIEMRVGGDSSGTGSFLPDNVTQIDLWNKDDHEAASVALLARYGDGTICELTDGYIASNQFIDQAQNADVLMNLVRTVAPPGSRIVFANAAFSDAEPGLIEVLGPGATGAWYQALFLFVVIVYTLGKRFGLPEEARAAQTGQRQLLEAIADTYLRARSTRVACRAAYDRADRDVRKALKLSSDAAASERDLHIPDSLVRAFRRTFEGTVDNIPPAEALARCRELRAATQRFLRPDPFAKPQPES